MILPPQPSCPSNTSPPAPHVLLVDDERKARQTLSEGFTLAGWAVTPVANGEEAVRVLGDSAFDVIVLDWMLPGLNGLDVLAAVRAKGLSTPVLMLTARDAVADRVRGLESGADDYLIKPFVFAELLARCRALTRRGAPPSSAPVLQFEDLQVDVRARTAIRAGEAISLTPREVDILEYLLLHAGQIVSRDMLQRDVWKQAQRYTSLDNVIDVQMARLRRKVDATPGEKLLHTVRGIGYRLGKADV